MACCDPEHVTKVPRDFQPNYLFAPVTEKFYARHECCNIPAQHRVDFYEQQLDKLERYQAREHYRVPRYTNQTYGWYLCPKRQVCPSAISAGDRFNIREARQKERNCYLNYCNQKFARYRQSRWKIV